jgi:hypothetical protein
MQRGQDRERGATKVNRGQAAGAIDEDAAKHGSSSEEKEVFAVSDEAKEDNGGGGAGWFGWMGIAALVVLAASFASDVLHLPPNLCRSPTLHGRALPPTDPKPFCRPRAQCSPSPDLASAAPEPTDIHPPPQPLDQDDVHAADLHACPGSPRRVESAAQLLPYALPRAGHPRPGDWLGIIQKCP